MAWQALLCRMVKHLEASKTMLRSHTTLLLLASGLDTVSKSCNNIPNPCA